MNLGHAIEQVRTLKHMSKTDLAYDSGLSIAFLSYIESNKRDATLESLRKITSALEISIFSLYLLATEEEDVTEFEYTEIKAMQKIVLDRFKQ